ncbi:MAG: SixA phosphatase family protein [Acidimicrobiales bacterium]
MAVLFVRHAEAGDRNRWEGPDEHRPLSPQGQAQAGGLVGVLAGFRLARVLSSPYLRCTQTVEPVAAARGLAVEPTNDLAEGAGRAGLTLVRSLLEGASYVALCTHGDVMEDVLDGLRVRRSKETEKGATWVLDAGAAARYLPPPG